MRFSLILAALFIYGCATPISNKAAGIQLVRQTNSLISACKNLGPVNVTVSDPLLGADSAADRAVVKARENAADMGADTLVILNRDELSGVAVTIQSTALRCY